MPKTVDTIDHNLLTIEAALVNFLDRKKQGTLLLKGAWGVGKTHFCREFVSAYQRRREPGPGLGKWFRRNGKQSDEVFKHAYVSLFGIRSVAELRRSVVEAAGARWISRMVQAVGTGKVPRSAAGMGVPADASQWLADSFLRNCLVCFDDVERKHSDFQLAEFFGFIDYLRNEKNCQCVVILNEDALGQEECDLLRRYRDKIIDIEMQFAPSLDRNAQVVFKAKEDEQIRRVVVDVFKRLGSRNIRALQRVQWAIEQLSSILAEADSDVAERLIRQIAALVLFRFEHESLIYDSMLSSAAAPAGAAEEPDKKVEDKLGALIAAAQLEPHDLDGVIWELLTNGYLCSPQSRSALKAWQDNLKRQRVGLAFEELKKLAWSSFETTEQACVEKALKLLEDHLDELKPDEFQELVGFLSRVDGTTNTRLWHERYIAEHIESATLDALETFESWPIDEALRQKIARQREQLWRKRGIAEIMAALGEFADGGPDEFNYLNSHSTGELLEYFALKARHGVRELNGLVCRLLEPASKTEAELARKLKEIAETLGARSTLDALRCEDALKTLNAFLDRVHAS